MSRDLMFRLSESPEIRPQERRYEQTIELDTKYPSEHRAYLSRPLDEYSDRGLGFLNSHREDDISSLRASYPSQSGSENPILQHRYKTGYSGSRFGVTTEYQGSAPAMDAARSDPWRDELSRAKARSKGSLYEEYMNSPFKTESNTYHALGKDDERASSKYNEYRQKTPPINRELRRSSPDLYTQGSPGGSYQTRGWYGDALDLAVEAEARANEALLAREKYREDYVGYDSLRAHQGHSEQIRQRTKRLEDLQAEVASLRRGYETPYQGIYEGL